VLLDMLAKKPDRGTVSPIALLLLAFVPLLFVQADQTTAIIALISRKALYYRSVWSRPIALAARVV
jgi:hypothetical protein